ncbi:hypothetical protein IPJ91_02080 [bacterium]|nr:MAG: hypothetical protein IPJ91_02080 [bacterium]
MKQINVMKSIFILCGCPMTGNTTIMLSLAYIKQAGIVSGSLRPVARKLELEDHGEEFDKLMGSKLAELIDPINDKYLIEAAKLSQEKYKNAVIESKPGARFRKYKSDLNNEQNLNLDFGESSTAIFLFANWKVIQKRAEINGRTKDLLKQKERMVSDNSHYLTNYNFEPYEFRDWSRYVDIPINNSDISVKSTLEVIFKYLNYELTAEEKERLDWIHSLYGENAENAKVAGEVILQKLKSNDQFFDPDWISDNVVRELEEKYGVTRDNYQGYFEK